MMCPKMSPHAVQRVPQMPPSPLSPAGSVQLARSCHQCPWLHRPLAERVIEPVSHNEKGGRETHQGAAWCGSTGLTPFGCSLDWNNINDVKTSRCFWGGRETDLGERPRPTPVGGSVFVTRFKRRGVRHVCLQTPAWCPRRTGKH